LLLQLWLSDRLKKVVKEGKSLDQIKEEVF